MEQKTYSTFCPYCDEEVEAILDIRTERHCVRGEEIMALFGLSPCAEVGELKAAIKDAILNGEIPNEHDAAKAYLLEKAAAMGLRPVGS